MRCTTESEKDELDTLNTLGQQTNPRPGKSPTPCMKDHDETGYIDPTKGRPTTMPKQGSVKNTILTPPTPGNPPSSVRPEGWIQSILIQKSLTCEAKGSGGAQEPEEGGTGRTKGGVDVRHVVLFRAQKGWRNRPIGTLGCVLELLVGDGMVGMEGARLCYFLPAPRVQPASSSPSPHAVTHTEKICQVLTSMKIFTKPCLFFTSTAPQPHAKPYAFLLGAALTPFFKVMYPSFPPIFW